MLETGLLTLLNGASYGLLLFLLSAGLTLIFGLLGVLNFAHGAFYMLGAYIALALLPRVGFVAALLLAPLAVGALGAAFERWALRRVSPRGHVHELLLTFALGEVLVEAVQWLWGRSPQTLALPAAWQGALWQVAGVSFPTYRLVMMGVAVLLLAGLAALWHGSRLGLLIRAALSQPHMVQAAGHNLPALVSVVFGVGCALAALAGVLAGAAWVVEPAMAYQMGALVFVVVVVGGLGSVAGAWWASLGLGLLQTALVALPGTLGEAARAAGMPLQGLDAAWANLRWSQLAGVAPYLVLVAVLVWRPQGLLGWDERHAL
jgi:branched-chain amino acid transport system permease protein